MEPEVAQLQRQSTSSTDEPEEPSTTAAFWVHTRLASDERWLEDHTCPQLRTLARWDRGPDLLNHPGSSLKCNIEGGRDPIASYRQGWRISAG